jgi:hypothetical protein
MQYKLTSRQMQLEQEIDFKLRLAEVYKVFGDKCPESAAKEYYRNTVEELCNEAHALGLQHQEIREHTQAEKNLILQQNLS